MRPIRSTALTKDSLDLLQEDKFRERAAQEEHLRLFPFCLLFHKSST